MSGATDNKIVNRLADSKSPYLIKHSRNPVHWQPWDEAAFDLARETDRPVFLSIGYATCHWCNVMEEESFEDKEVAAVLNDNFICIKVDREERPDIDAIYMDVCQLLTGGGGWPLTIVMTPYKQPFFAGTFFPKYSRLGKIGLLELIPRIAELWKTSRAELASSAGRITSAIAAPRPAGGKNTDPAIIDAAFDQFKKRFDHTHGGFGLHPKFPMPHALMFLHRLSKVKAHKPAMKMSETTLKHMRLGGMFDHLGGGFHRYSTDSMWRVPHFEKMLYDQALMMIAYCEAHLASGLEIYADTVRLTADYALNNLMSQEGAFYTAESADSEGREGRFYLWSMQEIMEALPKEEADMIIKAFNIHDEGNYIDELEGGYTGFNVLYLDSAMEDTAKRIGASVDALKSAIGKLYDAREKRPRPALDDKILTDMNGLMIAAMAFAGASLNAPRYLDAAKRAAGFILDRMRDKSGRLMHRYFRGHAGVGAVAEDYAFLTWGMLELYEASFDAAYLGHAVMLAGDFKKLHFDGSSGAFCQTPIDSAELPVKKITAYDGAWPSANSVAMMNLVRLGRMTGDMGFTADAGSIAKAFFEEAEDSPTAYAHYLSALMMLNEPSMEIVITGRPGADDTQALIDALHASFAPNKAAIFRPTGASDADIIKLAPFVKGLGLPDGRAAAYICRDYSCQNPITDPAAFGNLLKGI